MTWIEPWWSRTPNGKIRMALDAADAAVIVRLVAEVRDLLRGPAEDPVMQRLFPRAYLDPTEEAAETTWRALAGPDLLRDRLDRLDRIEAALGAIASGSVAFVELDDEAESDWLGVINDTRLALGTALGVRDDDDPDDDDLDHDDPDDDEGDDDRDEDRDADRDDDRDDDRGDDWSDATAPARHLYQVLTYRQEELVSLLFETLPIDGLDDP